MNNNLLNNPWDKEQTKMEITSIKGILMEWKRKYNLSDATKGILRGKTEKQGIIPCAIWGQRYYDTKIKQRFTKNQNKMIG